MRLSLRRVSARYVCQALTICASVAGLYMGSDVIRTIRRIYLVEVDDRHQTVMPTGTSGVHVREDVVLAAQVPQVAAHTRPYAHASV